MDPYASEDSNNSARGGAPISSETRELEEIARRLGRLMPSRRPVDWKESRRWNIEALQELSKSEENDRLVERLDGARFKVGGDEHYLIHVDEEPDRIYKVTYGDSFGCRCILDKIDEERSGKNFNATLNDDPRFYINRWILLNRIGAYQTRYEGILPPERHHWAPRICVSQPWLDGGNPGDTEIVAAMLRVGFIEVSQNTFFRPISKLLLTDVAPRNVRISGGGIVLFDAIAETASMEVTDWIQRRNPWMGRPI